MSERSLTIGEVAAQLGLRTSALRYYEEAGILPRAERVSGQRRYGPETVELLRLVRFCQGVGFSLAEVRELLRPATSRGAKQTWRRLVDAKLAEVTALIAHAEAVRELLEQSRDCDCLRIEDCSFVQAGAPGAPASARQG